MRISATDPIWNPSCCRRICAERSVSPTTPGTFNRRWPPLIHTLTLRSRRVVDPAVGSWSSDLPGRHFRIEPPPFLDLQPEPELRQHGIRFVHRAAAEIRQQHVTRLRRDSRRRRGEERVRHDERAGEDEPLAGGPYARGQHEVSTVYQNRRVKRLEAVEVRQRAQRAGFVQDRGDSVEMRRS